MADIISKTIDTQIRQKLSDGTYQLEHPETKIENVLGKATKEEAEAGVDNAKYMTPLTTLKAINKTKNIAVGSYRGTEEYNRISVGFEPKFVIVSALRPGNVNTEVVFFIGEIGLGIRGRAIESTELKTYITNSGFSLEPSSLINRSRQYTYVAFK